MKLVADPVITYIRNIIYEIFSVIGLVLIFAKKVNNRVMTEFMMHIF